MSKIVANWVEKIFMTFSNERTQNGGSRPHFVYQTAQRYPPKQDIFIMGFIVSIPV